MLDPSASCGRSAEARELRLLADESVALLDAWTPHLLTVVPRETFDRVRLYARSAVGLLRYHHGMADASPNRLARLTGLRDLMMAENLLALAERGPVLAHAHNAHLQRDISSMRMGGERLEWWSAGSLVDARLGEAYGFLATAFGTLRHQGVGAPPPTPWRGPCTGTGRRAAWWAGPVWPPRSALPAPGRAPPRTSATPRSTRRIWPGSTASCS